MGESFLEDGLDVARGDKAAHAPAEQIREQLADQHVCPFCGALKQRADGPCPRCTLENTAQTRQATKTRIGPWYVMQARNPAAPGMKFETLLAFVRKGRVRPRTIVRGPTTHQLWRFAAQVKGLSREFGICYSCGDSIDPTANLCPHCNRLQEPPGNPDAFLESTETDGQRPGSGLPVYREISAAPLLAEDIAAPAPAATPGKPAVPPTIQPARDASPAPAAAARPRKGNHDGFLSASELAAAFKLKTTNAPAAGGTAAPARPARRRVRLGRWVVMLLLIAAVGASAYEYRRNPAFRARAGAWYAQAADWTRHKLESMRQASKPPRPAVDHPDPLNVRPQAQTPSGDNDPQRSWDRLLPGATSKPNDWDQLFPQARGISTEPSTSTAPKHREGTIDDVRLLYRSAIDAESRGDYAAAASNYAQIKEFSPDLWPGDLDLRLKEARARAAR